MEITLTLADMMKILLCIAGLFALIYLCIALKNLVTTLKSLDAVLKDTSKMTSIAAKRADDIDGIVDSFVGAVGSMKKSIKSEERLGSIFASIVSIISTLRDAHNRTKGK